MPEVFQGEYDDQHYERPNTILRAPDAYRLLFTNMRSGSKHLYKRPPKDDKMEGASIALNIAEHIS